MADASDVLNALVTTIAAVIYPSGPTSALGFDARVYAGWPTPSLDADLAAGVAHVSVFPAGGESNVTRFPQRWQTSSINAVTLAAVVSGTSVTISGTASVGQNVMVKASNQAFAYAALGTDTPTSIAAALASLINPTIPATSSGPTLSIPSAYHLACLIGASGTSIRETKRQKRRFQITLWAFSPAARSTLGSAIDAALSGLEFLTLSDGSNGRLIYQSDAWSDGPQKERLYRRDLFYSVEYPTTQTRTDTQLLALTETIGGGLDPTYPVIDTIVQ